MIESIVWRKAFVILLPALLMMETRSFAHLLKTGSLLLLLLLTSLRACCRSNASLQIPFVFFLLSFIIIFFPPVFLGLLAFGKWIPVCLLRMPPDETREKQQRTEITNAAARGMKAAVVEQHHGLLSALARHQTFGNPANIRPCWIGRQTTGSQGGIFFLLLSW